MRCLQMPEARVPRRCEEASWEGFEAEQFRALPETLEHEVGAEFQALGSRLIGCPHLHLMPSAYTPACGCASRDGRMGLQGSSCLLIFSRVHQGILRFSNGFLRFWCSPKFFCVLRVFSGSSGFFLVFQGLSGFVRVFPDSSGFVRALQGLSGFVRVFWVLQGLSGFVRVLKVYQYFSAPRRYQGARGPGPGGSRERVGPAQGGPGSAWALPKRDPGSA